MKFSQNETILHKLKPSPWLIVIWFFSRCILHGFAAAFFCWFAIYMRWFFKVAYGKNEVLLDLDAIFLSTLFGIFIVVLSYVYHRFLIQTITYYITDKRCVYMGGIFKKVEHSVSYYKITDVERSRNLIEQLLKLSRVDLFTPGTASMRTPARPQPMPELSFVGLRYDESEDAANAINEHIRLHAGREV